MVETGDGIEGLFRHMANFGRRWVQALKTVCSPYEMQAIMAENIEDASRRKTTHQVKEEGVHL